MVAYTLNIDLELVSVKPSNNLTSPNGMVSGGSIASEACAYVSIKICSILVCFFTFASYSTEIICKYGSFSIGGYFIW